MWEETKTGFNDEIQEVCSNHGLAVQTIEQTTERTANTVFRLTLENGETKIFKVYTFLHFENGMVRGAGGLQRTISRYSECVPEIHHMGTLPTTNYVYHINEYIEGESFSEQWREENSPQTQHNLVEYCAKLLSTIHTIPEEFNVVGEVTEYDWETEEYGVRTEDGWPTTIQTILDRREAQARKTSPIPTEQTEELITILEETIGLIPETIERPVIGHNDLRVPNIIVKDHSEPVIVDWDNGFIGDWLYAYTMAEYMMHNKPSRETSVSRSELRDAFRETYFSTSDFEYSTNLPPRYWYYYGLKLLQELRSFNYWYQDHSETFRQRQANWLEGQVDCVVEKLQKEK